MRKISLLGLFFIFAVFPLTVRAQVPPESAVYAPFVSRIQGELRGNFLRLSWTDSPDARGPVYIYRSNSPFEGAIQPAGIHSGIRPVEVAYGAQSYVDEIESGSITGNNLYYYVAASDERGRSYDIPMAYINTIGIYIPPGSVPAPGVTREPGTSETPAYRARGIASLTASPQRDSIIITFTGGDSENVTLYRSIRPISAMADLLGAVIVQSGIKSPFTDQASAGIPYYYAVIPDDELLRGTVSIEQGRNSTARAVQISTPESGQDNRSIRSMPLPNISVQAAIPGLSAYTEVPSITAISPEASNALGDIPRAAQTEPAAKRPRLFARDTEPPAAGGEEYFLYSIVTRLFITGNWDAAREELQNFLALPRLPEVSARARFYLGQCYYFLRMPRESLFEFLAIQDRYPAEAADWIRSSLSMIAYQ